MRNLFQKFRRPLTSPGLTGLLLVATICLSSAFDSRSAQAAPDETSDNIPRQTLEFDLDSYTPDQSLWSDKTKAKYEKAKFTEKPPLALLTIERLNLEAPIYLGTDRVTLDRGLGLIKSTARPGEVGNIALSGHRDSFFRSLKDIKKGDTIKMQTPDGIENFEVSDIFIVDALDVSVIAPTDTTVLTLITCHPFYYVGYAPDRYIVRATPIGK
jgi:sortase A